MAKKSPTRQAITDLMKLLENHDVEFYARQKNGRTIYTICAWQGENQIHEQSRGDLPQALRRLASAIEPGRG